VKPTDLLGDVAAEVVCALIGKGETGMRLLETTPFEYDPFLRSLVAHHRSIFALHQGVVGRAAGAGLREFHQQLVQHFLHLMIQKLRAVVTVEPHNAKGKLMQHRLQHRDQIPLADGFYAPDHLPLRHRVHSVDVIDPRGGHRVALDALCPPADNLACPADLACASLRSIPVVLGCVARAHDTGGSAPSDAGYKDAKPKS